VRDYILDVLEDDEPSDTIKYEKFEAYLLDVLNKNEYEPNPAEHLIAAFKVLDPEGKGYIRKDVMKNLLTTQGIKFRPREYYNFENYGLDKSGKYFYYEDYIAKMVQSQE